MFSRGGSVEVPGFYIPEMPHRAAPELDRTSLTHKRKVQNAGREHDHIVVSAFPARPLGVLPQLLQRASIYTIKCIKGCKVYHGFSVSIPPAFPGASSNLSQPLTA